MSAIMPTLFARSGLWAAIAFLIASPAARADVLFQSLADLTITPDAYFCSDCFGSGDRVFDVFTPTLGGAANLATVAVESGVFGPSAISMDLYEGAPGSLGALLLSGVTNPADFLALSPTASDTTIVSFVLPSVDLLAGHTYSISFFNPDTLLLPGYDGGASVSWQNGAPLGFGTSSGFRIEGVAVVAGVPEPAAWGLMIAGFAASGLMLRRKVRRPARAS